MSRGFLMHKAHVAVKQAGAIRRKKLAQQAAEDQKGHCIYCNAAFTEKRPPTFEHIVPKSKGGLDVASNCAASCFRCNQERGTANHDAFRRYKQRGSLPPDEQQIDLPSEAQSGGRLAGKSGAKR